MNQKVDEYFNGGYADFKAHIKTSTGVATGTPTLAGFKSTVESQQGQATIKTERGLTLGFAATLGVELKIQLEPASK